MKNMIWAPLVILATLASHSKAFAFEDNAYTNTVNDALDANLDANLIMGGTFSLGGLAAGSTSLVALRNYNTEIRDAWKDALPNESREFYAAQNELEKKSNNLYRAQSEYSEMEDAYKKARDGYQVESSKTEYNLHQAVDEHGVPQGRLVYGPQEVKVITKYAPDPAKEAKLAPQLAKLKAEMNAQQKLADAAESLFKSKKETFDKSMRQIMNGDRNLANASLLERIKGLKIKRGLAITGAIGSGVMIVGGVGAAVIDSSQPARKIDSSHFNTNENTKNMEYFDRAE